MGAVAHIQSTTPHSNGDTNRSSIVPNDQNEETATNHEAESKVTETSITTKEITDRFVQLALPTFCDRTPLHKMNQILSKHLFSVNHPETTYAILITTGALNPIHLGHVDILECAKVEIEKIYPKQKVIAGFMSPSHDQYLRGKFGKSKYIPSKYRLKMVEMATTYSEWISVDPWECQQNCFKDFPEVAARLKRDLQSIYCGQSKCMKKSQLVVYYCCGLDHADKCGLLSGSLFRKGVRTLVVRRPSKELNKVKLKSNLKKGVVVVDAPPVDYDRSSTVVRQLLSGEKWKELERYLHPKVIEYLKEDPDKIVKRVKRRTGQLKLPK